MFEVEKDLIVKARARYYNFSKKEFASKLESQITDMIANDVHMPVVAEVKRYSITANCTTAEAIKHIASMQAEDRADREAHKFAGTIQQMLQDFAPIREQVDFMRQTLGLQFAYGVKAKGENDGFQPILQTIAEFETFSALMPYKDNLFAIEVKVGRSVFKKVKSGKEEEA